MRIFIAVILAVIYSFVNMTTAYADNNVSGAKSQKHFRLRYVINIAELDSTFEDNTQRINSLLDFLREIGRDSTITVSGVDFRGTASPDGSYEFNVWLSENRLRTFKEMVRQYVDIPDSLIHTQTSAIPWDEFRMQVEQSNLDEKGEVLDIIDEESRLVPWTRGRHIDARLLKLKSLDGGKVWDKLRKPILYDLRYGDVVFYLNQRMPGIYPEFIAVETAAAPPALLPVQIPDVNVWTPNKYLKTNILGWVMGSVNLAYEFDFAPHWSFTIPIYYCAWDYFISTVKFRNFTLQPEVRYWPNANGYNHGFFVGLHAGMMAYNFAVNGTYRYQDRKGTHPALGGGLAIGYRKAISSNKRWHLEFSAGAGIYKLDYDVFENTPNYKEGQWVRRKKKMFYGLDQLTLSIAYSFPSYNRQRIIKKGGSL